MVEASDSPFSLLGVLNDKYALVMFLGEGTTSKVYLSLSVDDQMPSAIKLFKTEFLNRGLESRRIFISEVTALTRLDHPNIVKMYEHSIEGVLENPPGTLLMDNIWFIALEYI